MNDLSDTQSERDSRGLRIDRVGLRGLRYPVIVDGRPTVGLFSLTVELPATQRGTHMSRFVEVLHEGHGDLDAAGFIAVARKLRNKLKAPAARIEMTCPWFVEKAAPVTGLVGMLDYEVKWIAEVRGNATEFTASVAVPISTVCPCSKAISERGAHNQRGIATLAARAARPVSIGKLVAAVEGAASCELYSLLKRPDEKFVTERAYDNPVFVEDLVRTMAEVAQKWPGIRWYRAEAENFESIHSHNAYAMIEGP